MSRPSEWAGGFSLRSAIAYFCLSAVLDVVMAGKLLGPVRDGELYNSDSYMRLVRLREIVAQHEAVHVVAGDGSGTPTVLHWSHLLDSVLLLIADPLGLFVAGDASLFTAGVLLGPIGVGCLGVALAWVLAPLTAPGWRWLAPVLAGVSPPVAAYGLPGVVHHHVLLAVVVVMVAGWCGRANRLGADAGWRAGLWGAAGIWLSPETMPFTLAGFGAMGLGWLLGHPASAAGLRAGGTALLLGLAAMLLVDPPYEGIAHATILRLSVVYLVLGVVAAAIGWTIWAVERSAWPRPRRIAAGLAASAVLLGLWLALFPDVIKGPDGLMSPEETRALFGFIAEMQPVRRLSDAALYLTTGLLAVVVFGALAWQRRSLLWAYAAACAAIVLLLGVWHVRFATYPAAFGAASLPLAMRMASNPAWPPAAQSLGRVGAMALFLLLPFAGQLGSVIEAPSELLAAETRPSCPLRGAVVELLAPYAGQTVLADPAETPELLYRTGVKTVGSLYINIAGYMRLRAAWRSESPEAVPASIRATGASLVLVCPSSNAAGKRSLMVADLARDTLLDRLNANEPPPWLRLVGRAGGHVLYAISGSPT